MHQKLTKHGEFVSKQPTPYQNSCWVKEYLYYLQDVVFENNPSDHETWSIECHVEIHVDYTSILHSHTPLVPQAECEANLDRPRLFHQWECLKCNGHRPSVSCVKWPLSTDLFFNCRSGGHVVFFCKGNHALGSEFQVWCVCFVLLAFGHIGFYQYLHQAWSKTCGRPHQMNGENLTTSTIVSH
jgi:hypothetical protein